MFPRMAGLQTIFIFFFALLHHLAFSTMNTYHFYNHKGGYVIQSNRKEKLFPIYFKIIKI